jgi:hypothetical protein
MMICVLDVHITGDFVLLSDNCTCGDWSTSCRASFVCKGLRRKVLPLNSLTSKRVARSISKGEGPRPGHLRVMRFPVSCFCNCAVNVLIFACFFSTISSPGS